MSFSSSSATIFVKIMYVTCILLLRITHGSGGNTHRKYEHFSDDVQNYLMEFGYLPKSDIETGNLRTETQLTSAIKSLQKFGNIPETGIIDENTRKLMRRPRCGQPDNKISLDFTATNRFWNNKRGRSKRFVIQGSKWPTTSLTWSLVNQTMTTLDAGQVRRVLTEALDVWARSSRLTFQEVYSEEADIQVLFAKRYHGDGYDFDGQGSVLAHAFYPGPGRGGDAHFDEEENWILSSDQNVEGTKLVAVAVHEFGHSLGLGHSSVEDAIMFPWYHGYEMYKDLPEDDRIAIQEIYGSREKQWGHNSHQPAHRPRTRPTEVATTTTTTTTTTRKPYYPDQRYYPDRENTERPVYRTRKPYYPYDPKHYPYNPRVFTERPEQDYPKKPYYPKYPEKNYPRYYPDRPRHHTTIRPRHTNKNDKPDTCNTSYDSITVIRGELFVFKDRYLWRIGEQGLYAGYPYEITRVWSNLPSNFTHVDAVYENKEMKIVFFIGKLYYVFNPNELESGYPKPLTHLGLPSSLEKVDSVLVWGHNNRTYIYSGTMYWRFDEDINHIELDYPRDMSIWRGIGYHIDAAFQWKDGKSYFFKGKSYWKFDDSIMHVAHNQPEPSATRWMGCPRPTHQDVEEVPTEKAPLKSGAAAALHNQHTFLGFLFLSIIFLYSS